MYYIIFYWFKQIDDEEQKISIWEIFMIEKL